MVFPKPPASSSTISSPPEESRVGQVDSRESLDPSSSSATSLSRVQVLDSSEPLVSCVQVIDSNEPLVRISATKPMADVQVVETLEFPTHTDKPVANPMSPAPGCSHWDETSYASRVSELPVSPTFTEQSGCESLDPSFSSATSTQHVESSEPLVRISVVKPMADVQVVETVANPTTPAPGCSHWDETSYASRVPELPVSPTFTEQSGFAWDAEDHMGSPAHFDQSDGRVAPAAPSGSSGRRVHLYKEEIKNQWNFRKILEVFHSDDASVKFAEEQGLIPREKICTQHKKPMIIEKAGQLGIFRCRRSNCRRRAESRAKGTWFEQVHLNIQIMFEMMYMFTSGFTYEQVQRETSRADRAEVISQHTIADWYSYCRETIVVYELEHEEEKPKIGGPGKIVQIDESKFGKRKYNRGRQVEGHWVLGMIEDGSDDLRVVVCPDNVRSADVLVPIIKKHVQEGSIIHTDMWRAYDCLPEHNYIHKKVNHSDPEHRFVAPDGTHTQRIESHWRGLKRHFHKDNYKGNFTDWLIEYSWRRKIKINMLDPFEELLKCIRYVYRIE